MRPNPKNRAFPPTSSVWTLIRYAGDPTSPRAHQSFAALYEKYSFPLYAQLRAWGVSHHEAEDLIHDFFLYANERRLVDRNDPAKGRFRTFLLKCLKNFMLSKIDSANAARHGSRKRTISFDGMAAATRYAAEPLDHGSPDKILVKKLALQVGQQSLKELELEAIAEGKGDLYVALGGYLGADTPIETYRALAVRLNIPAGTLKSQASDWRKRLREIFKDQVEPLVDDPADVRPEIVALEEALDEEPSDSAAPRPPLASE